MFGALLSLVAGVLFDPHTYVGLVIGALIGWMGLKSIVTRVVAAVKAEAQKVGI